MRAAGILLLGTGIFFISLVTFICILLVNWAAVIVIVLFLYFTAPGKSIIKRIISSGLYKWLKNNSGIATNSALSAATIVICLLIWEMYLRTDITLQSYPERNNSASFQSPYQDANNTWFHTYRPNEIWVGDTKEFTHYVHAGKLGLNDKDYPLNKNSSIRIVALGDSFTEGVGAVGDSSYPKILQSILPHTEVMNCGVSGSDPVFECKLLQKKLIAYKPDIVTVAVNESDINDVIVRGGFERFHADGTFQCRKGPWWQFLFATSYIARLVVIKLLHMDFFFLTPEKRLAESKTALHILSSAIDSIQTTCNTNHIRCIFIFHPVKSEIEAGKMDCNPVLQYARQKGCETIDMLSYFQKNGVTTRNLPNYFWKIDGHNNNTGYILFATAIKEHIQN